MKRLVYSPYVQAFVKTDDGVFDLSPYIVRGDVNRKLNQVSTASLVLRNPLYGNGNNLLFTEYATAGNPEPHPLIHPMDPITIFMERLAGHRVRVFTGYVDTSPYHQFYPGLCKIEASCTLKRLNYTVWDASLPSVTQLLTTYGWQADGKGGAISRIGNTEKINISTGGKKTNGQFTDGSLGALLFGILNVVGDWDASTIWIEKLPPNLKDIILGIYKKIAPEAQASQDLVHDLIQQVLGATAQGSGSPSGSGSAANGSLNGPITIKGAAPNEEQKTLVKQVMDIATGLNAPKLAIETLLAACIQENDFSNKQGTPDQNGSVGLLQLTTATSASTGIGQYDVPGQVTYFLTKGFTGRGGAISVAQANPNYTIGQVIDVMQNPGGGSNYNRWKDEADKIINAYSANGSTSSSTSSNTSNSTANNTSSAAPTAGTTTADTSTTTSTTTAGKTPGGSSSSTSTATTSTGGASTGNAQGQGGQITVYAAMEKGAAAIDAQNYKYIWGGGHGDAGTPSIGIQGHGYDGHTQGFDCSGAVGAVFKAAGIISGGFGNNDSLIQELEGKGALVQGADSSPNAVNVYNKTSVHIFMKIGSNFWGTTDATGQLAHGGGAGWLSNASAGDYTPYHVPAAKLAEMTTYQLNLNGGSVPGGGGGGGSGSGSGSTMAAAFAAMLDLPSVFEAEKSLYFKGKRSFIADQPLLPFIIQLCTASMRSFCSMPNGNFFAFFPDYFGLFGRKYYWPIYDIEIIDARIDLSDDALLTHVAVEGDTLVQGSVTFFDQIYTAGIFDIYDAIASGFVGSGKSLEARAYKSASGKEAAVAFLQKYGVRTLVEQIPAIRSPFYELFFAFQTFMLAWAKQYLTTFELTFMPEIFPGGIIGLPDHHIQVYVEEVVHHFDYESGFTTNINISAPSALESNKTRTNISDGLARKLPKADTGINLTAKEKQLVKRG